MYGTEASIITAGRARAIPPGAALVPDWRSIAMTPNKGAAAKRGRLIKHDEIADIFDDPQIKILARDAKLEFSPAQLAVFGRAIKMAVDDYLTAVVAPSQQQIRSEVEKLWRAASEAVKAADEHATRSRVRLLQKLHNPGKDSGPAPIEHVRLKLKKLEQKAARAHRARLIDALAAVSEYTRLALNRRGESFSVEENPGAGSTSQIEQRGSSTGQLDRHVQRCRPIELPTVQTLKEEKITVLDAARAILALVSLGAHVEDGRRTKETVPALFVPVAPQVDFRPPATSFSNEGKRRAPRRSAERDLVVALRLAWIEAAELDQPLQRDPQGPEPAREPFPAPALTALRGSEGPFAQLVILVFAWIGITDVDVVETINSLAASRSAEESKKNQKLPFGRA